MNFEDILERRNSYRETAEETIANRGSNLAKLSYILENSLCFEFEKQCGKCKEPLREEELFTGFQKNSSNYTVKCPYCKAMFRPKFKIYSEAESKFVNGRQGKVMMLLPPVTLYKEFYNIVVKKGDQILLSNEFH